MRDCSGSSSPGEDVAETVVEPELWQPSPPGDAGGLLFDGVAFADMQANIGTKFFATPAVK